MRELRDRVAVVTGAASGLGRAIAARFAREGMHVVLADVEQTPLAAAASELEATGATVLAVPTDVTKGRAVDALAEQTLARFGAVHLVCNNAGVAMSRRAWELTPADWEWVLSVNLWGVINGVRAFVPPLLAQQSEGHIVNTASVWGLFTSQGMAAYAVSKYGVVALSETLAQDLAEVGSPVKVSVVCPGFTPTNLATAARNRPDGAATSMQDGPNPLTTVFEQAVAAGMQFPMTADAVAEQVVKAVQEERFWVLPHPGYRAQVERRLQNLHADGYPQPTTAAEFIAGQVRAYNGQAR